MTFYRDVAYFSFYDKKRETFYIFSVLIFLDFIKKNGQIHVTILYLTIYNVYILS